MTSTIGISYPVTLSGSGVAGKLTCNQFKVATTELTTPLTTAGSVAENNAGFLTGGTVYTALGGATLSAGIDTALRDGTTRIGAISTSENASGSDFYNITVTDGAIKFSKGDPSTAANVIMEISG